MPPREALNSTHSMIPMRSSITVVALLLSGAIGFGATNQSPQARHPQNASLSGVVMKTRENSRYMPGRVIVKMKPETAGSGLSKTSSALSSLNTFVQQYGTKSVASMFPGETPPKGTGSIDMTRFYVVDYASPVDAFTAAAEISGRPEVEYAEPWCIYFVDGSEATPPNDSFFSHQWYLQKIQMESAWAVSQGHTN